MLLPLCPFFEPDSTIIISWTALNMRSVEVSILSLQRDMQKLLATYNIYGKLNRPTSVVSEHQLKPYFDIACRCSCHEGFVRVSVE